MREGLRSLGRYEVYDEIALGGMASVHLGRLVGPNGFSRTVAIKRLHRQFGGDRAFVDMLLDEARLAARIRHPNVAATLDVVENADDVLLVMEYVHGPSLSQLIDLSEEHGKPRRVEPSIALAVALGLLQGLHAAHEATREDGSPLLIVHRDVSPHNVLVDVDGVTRIVDFGVAKALGRSQTTQDGRIKGKTAYMAPEQLQGKPVDRRADIFAAGIVLWELLVGRSLFASDTAAGTMMRVLEMPVDAPSLYDPTLAPFDAVCARALHRDLACRFQTAEEMGAELERVGSPATARKLGHWVRDLSGESLASRAARLQAIEMGSAKPMSHGRIPIARQHVPSTPAMVTTPPPVRPPRSRGRALAVFAALAVVLPATLWAARRGIASEPLAARAGAMGAELSERGASPTHTVHEQGAQDERAKAGVRTESSTAASVSSPKPPLKPVVATVVSVNGSRPTPSASPTSRQKPNDCSPPYTINADGDRVPKPQCL